MKNYFLIQTMVFVLPTEGKSSIVFHYCVCHSLTQKRLKHCRKQLLGLFALCETGIVAFQVTVSHASCPSTWDLLLNG